MTASWRADWLATVVQGLPQLLTLRRHMVPTLQFQTVASIDPAVLRSHGISAVIWDVDGTLMRRHGSAVDPGCAAAFARLCSDPGLRHAILSNCSEPRFIELSTIFPAIPILRVYESPTGVIVRTRVGDEECWHDGNGDPTEQRGGRVLRKPNVAMVRIALAELGCAQPRTALMVGDQYLTDIAPANVAGALTAKVRSVEPGSFPLGVRALQWAERQLCRLSSPRTPHG